MGKVERKVERKRLTIGGRRREWEGEGGGRENGRGKNGRRERGGEEERRERGRREE